MRLSYRSRGGASPQGKPRVYLTGHPADLPVCSEDIFTDILETQNCAIYYDEEPGQPFSLEELQGVLEQMRLLVIPVTFRFLLLPNRARDVEFPFAIERHIPVLPLMQEQGVETEFNRLWGSLQMLNRHDPDPTAVPYAEKLERFLSSVLVGDELARKARAAFDAYVFLSYRKKDRQYAQELMRLIHKNEFCRDIAIWYDEFLAPGEDFNQAIADAMKKCDLFAMAVTPSLLEPDNYVMTTEYPEAKKTDKIILPVEMVETDKSALKTAFPDIGDCAQAWEGEAFADMLLRAVKQVAVLENDRSPEHNFFIGLAYLNGIDVEVDRDRALSLITGAAEHNLPEAMKKLVHMYRRGDGVSRDYRAAVRWQMRLTDYREQRFRKNRTVKNGLEWIYALWSLGDYQRGLVDLSGAKQAYLQMAEVCESLNEQELLAVSYMKLGVIFRSEKRLAEAEDCQLRALDLNRKLCRKSGGRQGKWRRKQLSGCYMDLGDLSMDEGKMDQADDYYQKALEMFRQMIPEYGIDEIGESLASGCDRLGNIRRARGRLDEAEDYYRQAMELRGQLYQEEKTPRPGWTFLSVMNG